MTANALGAVARHESNDQPTQDGHKNFQPAELVTGRRHHARSPALEEEKISE